MAMNSSLGTPEQLRDPNYTPPLASAVPLGIQHVLAMFVSNVTPAIIIAGAAGFGFGSNSPDFPNLIYMIQMSMLFAGVATLFQTIGFGPVGARLPIVQGTSFAFIPIMIPLVAGKGVDAMGALMCGVIVGGLFHALLGTIIGRIRFALPPLVTGLVVTMIGLALVKVGIQYAAGGVPAMAKLTGALAAAKSSGTPADLSGIEYGSLLNWGVALVVIVVTLGVKFFTRGIVSVAAVLIGLIVGYVVAYFLGMVNFDNVGRAAVFARGAIDDAANGVGRAHALAPAADDGAIEDLHPLLLTLPDEDVDVDGVSDPDVGELLFDEVLLDSANSRHPRLL